jgi:hypothetical protein
MAVIIDQQRLIRGLAASLYQKVLPALPLGSARFTANAAAEMAVHALYRLNAPMRLPDATAAARMANEVRALTSHAVSDATAHHLLELLHADSRAYGEDFASYRTLMASIAEVKRAEFLPPDETRLTAVLRRITGDPEARARIVGQSVGGYSKQTVMFDHMN